MEFYATDRLGLKPVPGMLYVLRGRYSVNDEAYLCCLSMMSPSQEHVVYLGLSTCDVFEAGCSGRYNVLVFMSRFGICWRTVADLMPIQGPEVFWHDR